MDENIINSIEARKSAITDNYDLKGDLSTKFDQLFKKIEDLGKTAKDVGDFEAKFAASPLNQEYNDFFTEVATKNISLKNVAKSSGTSVGEMASRAVMDQAGSRLKQAVAPTRAQINQAAYDKARDIPGVGEAMSIKQHFDFFSRFKKPKN